MTPVLGPFRPFSAPSPSRQPDGVARYDLPPAQIERYVAGFIAEVSSA
jgi:hypothetical protein